MARRKNAGLAALLAQLAPEVGVHKTNPYLLSSTWSVGLVGAGGNGSHMAGGLARLHIAMLELGHPTGIDLTIYDDDRVSESNVGRQLFAMSDVGQFKSVVLANRLNAFYGLRVKAETRRFGEGKGENKYHQLIVSCVDSAASRRNIHHAIKLLVTNPAYWLDMGNDENDGQFILGEPLTDYWHRELKRDKEYARSRLSKRKQEAIGRGADSREHAKARVEAKERWLLNRLPCVTEEFPELLATDFAESDTPSCSLAEALSRQSLFINQAVSAHALGLLWSLFREGQVSHRGGFVNLRTGQVLPIPVEPELAAAAPRVRRKAAVAG